MKVLDNYHHPLCIEPAFHLTFCRSCHQNFGAVYNLSHFPKGEEKVSEFSEPDIENSIATCINILK